MNEGPSPAPTNDVRVASKRRRGAPCSSTRWPRCRCRCRQRSCRVLQERRFTRLGGGGEIACDVRVIAASNRNLQQMVGCGEFREDLYYRLNVVRLEIPPLNERREDIPLLARALFEKAATVHGVEVRPLPTGVLRLLMDYGWPGNVRELANAVERLVLLAENHEVSATDLPPEVLHQSASDNVLIELPPEGLDWERMEIDLLRQALARAGGNRAAAARLLKLPYKAVLYRLEKYELAVDDVPISGDGLLK